MNSKSIQWEAPSNRKSGRNKDTNRRRRDWWRRKAIEVGIDPKAPHWISSTAKFVHPTKKKPCKNCGRLMDIRYAYPSATLIRRIEALSFIDDSFPVDPLEHITSLVIRLVEQFGDHVFACLPALLNTSSIKAPALPCKLQDWLIWIEQEYIPHEPRTLSPGVMSNAPDRLDGFHSFNLCCRSKTDPGRSRVNLQSYTTDRRVFEYWVEGDWVAADRLMGIIRSDNDIKKCGLCQWTYWTLLCRPYWSNFSRVRAQAGIPASLQNMQQCQEQSNVHHRRKAPSRCRGKR